MIRYTLLTLFVMFFSVYSLRDWYRGLLGLLFMVAFVERPDMPEAMFGIVGITPFNFLLAFVLLGWLLDRTQTRPDWEIQRHVKLLLWALIGLLALGYVRMIVDLGGMYEFYAETGRAVPNRYEMFLEYFATSLKWAIPGVLVMLGCNSEKRLRETLLVFGVVIVLLAIQIIRAMPLNLLLDGGALEKRAARVMDRDLGFHRNQISVWMATGFWLIMLSYFEARERLWKFALAGSAAIVFLALILTGSRGGLLCWAGTGAVIACLRWRKILFVSPVILAIAFAAVPALDERLRSGLDRDAIYNWERTDTTGTLTRSELEMASLSAGRSIMWSEVIEEIAERPLVGYGREAMMRNGITSDLFRGYGPAMAARHPHNAYLQMLHENGLFGLAIVAAFFFVLGRKCISMFRSDHEFQRRVGGLGMAFVGGYLISGLTASSFYPNEGTIFVCAAIGLIIRVGLSNPKAQPVSAGVLDSTDSPAFGVGSRTGVTPRAR